MEAAVKLAAAGTKARVVSFPCWELFDKQDDDYRAALIPGDAAYAVVEAGIKMGWERYAGREGLYITMEDFGNRRLPGYYRSIWASPRRTS